MHLASDVPATEVSTIAVDRERWAFRCAPDEPAGIDVAGLEAIGAGRTDVSSDGLTAEEEEEPVKMGADEEVATTKPDPADDKPLADVVAAAAVARAAPAVSGEHNFLIRTFHPAKL